MHPVCFGFDASSDRGDEVALDAQKLLQQPLRLRVVSLAEMAIADRAVVLEGELRRVDSDDYEAVLAVTPRPCADVGLGALAPGRVTPAG